MGTIEILQKIAEYKKANDYEGFKILLESLDFDEAYQLKRFCLELNTYCDKVIKEQF